MILIVIILILFIDWFVHRLFLEIILIILNIFSSKGIKKKIYKIIIIKYRLLNYSLNNFIMIFIFSLPIKLSLFLEFYNLTLSDVSQFLKLFLESLSNCMQVCYLFVRIIFFLI